jgi:hypothetical protein
MLGSKTCLLEDDDSKNDIQESLDKMKSEKSGDSTTTGFTNQK